MKFDQSVPLVTLSVNSQDVARPHFTFTNLGAAPALGIQVDQLQNDDHTLDFETIEELRPGASVTCMSIVYPVVGNDPHWALDFLTASGDDFAVPVTVRYQDPDGRALHAPHTLRFDGRRVLCASHA